MILKSYYINLKRSLGEDFSDYKFDREGVPLTKFRRRTNWYHNPVTVCQYGLLHFNKYLSDQSAESKKIFLTQARWLIDHAEKDVHGWVVWYYRFDLHFYHITAPWISGMAQGEALSVLLRAHQLTGEETYLVTAHNAWNTFKFTVNHGGVISHFPDGKMIIEEYPSLKLLTGVLNGFISAMFGVYDYAIYTEDEKARHLFFDFVDSLKHNLHRYDCGYWSYYDLASPRRLASRSYHRLHIELLKVLSHITQQEVFKNIYERWQSYLRSPECNLKWLMRKIHQRLSAGQLR